MLSIPGKLLEGQICDTIDNHMNENRLISEKQWGFRKGRSTEGLLLKLTETWKAEIDKGFRFRFPKLIHRFPKGFRYSFARRPFI